MNLTFKDQSETYRSYIEAYLANYICQHADLPQKQLFDAMGYSLLAGGKRLRPVFVFDFCRIWRNADHGHGLACLGLYALGGGSDCCGNPWG